MADAYGSGMAIRNFLTKTIPGTVSNAATADQAGFGKSIGDVHGFLSGLFGGSQPSVTVALPPATPVAAKAAAAPAAKAAGLGTLSPAAAAVLANATGAPTPKAAAGADPLAGALGKLSFRQLLALSQASENLQPKGTAARPQSTSDAAGAALASIYQQQFNKTLEAAGDDPAKQKAAVDIYEQKMLPIALKGNTADEYLYGSQ